MQAIEQLNVKPKYWKDLLTDESFTRKDIIHIQDPQNLQARLWSREYNKGFWRLLLQKHAQCWAKYVCAVLGRLTSLCITAKPPAAHSCLLVPTANTTAVDLLYALLQMCDIVWAKRVQGRDTETFDHVKKDLHVEEEDESAGKGASLLAMSEDQKRMLARLNTSAATEVSFPLCCPLTARCCKRSI